MSESQSRAKKLEYLRIDQEARSLLSEFRPTVEKLIPQILDDFYRHIGEEDELRSMFVNEAHAAHAREAQAKHWMRMFSGKFDDEYFDSVARIGKAHCQLGLQPGWYIGGYGLIKQALIAAVLKEAAAGAVSFNGKGRLAKASKLIQSIDKAISLDMDLAISVYLAEKDADFSSRLNDLADQFGDVIAGIIGALSQSSAGLSAEAEGLQSNSEGTAQQADTAKNGAEEANSNAQTVAAAVEELSASIGEIASQVSDAARVTDAAVTKAATMTDSVGGLNEAAEKVGGIVRLIEEIAEQTNLLALNATIEAARAGEAGKGFAVVAGEVKSLAQQTANATGEIAGHVRAIQEATSGVGNQIDDISRAIGQMGEASGAIASAIEEQTSVTQEISRSVAETSTGVGAVLEAMQSVSAAAAETRQSAGKVTSASEDVRGKAQELDEQSKVFIDRIRHADRRKEVREETDASCMLTIDGKTISARMVDISPSGAAIRANGCDFQIGAAAVLQIDGHGNRLEGEVVSATTNRISLKFRPKLAEDVADKLRGVRRTAQASEAA
ncbi:protoglobin domain-containing protein [Pelagibius sp. CAU 1746]|uniref:protoglobin domain-containing protein n=1 Tax=Pelagibius sp. CAU 1746 TaxID=3140370 RepID=UPI00325AF7F8